MDFRTSKFEKFEDFASAYGKDVGFLACTLLKGCLRVEFRNDNDSLYYEIWILKIYRKPCMYIDSCLGVVPWGVVLVFREIVAIGVCSFEVAIYATIGFVAGVE